jgi:DNA-3-methyladenine glycosylase I
MAEHAAPERINPTTLGEYLEIMSKTVFQTGISWRVVASKWPGIREAFNGFEAEAVADLTEPELEALAGDTRVIRNRRKLQAIMSNAQRMLELEKRHGSFRSYLRSHGGFEAAVKDLRKQFKFVGDMGAYHFLYVVGEDVPSYPEWCASRGKEPPSTM